MYQGVQAPEVGVPGDAVGRGFTLAGYGSIGAPFLYAAKDGKSVGRMPIAAQAPLV
jgi:hypothetical protein